MSELIECSIASDEALLIGATSEGKLRSWSIKTGENGLNFGAYYDSGGTRISVFEKSKICASAAFGNTASGGVGCYDYTNGECLWIRDDLKEVQFLIFEPDSGDLYCCFDDKSAVILSPETGETKGKVEGVRKLFFDHSSDRVFVVKDEPEITDVLLNPLYRIEKLNYIIDVEFGLSLVLISESAGEVHVYHVLSGKKIGVIAPPKNTHVLHIFYSERRQCFFGVAWNYEDGGDELICNIDLDTLEMQETFDIKGGYVVSYLRNKDALILSNGNVIDISSGNQSRLLKL